MYKEKFEEFRGKISEIISKNEHIAARHQLSVGELETRRKLKKNEFVSTFEDFSTPANSLKDLFADEIVCKEVFDWVVNRDGEYPESDWLISELMPYRTGFGFNLRDERIDCNGVEVVLHRTDENSFGFIVKTMYPVKL